MNQIELSNQTVLITGAAGFIGAALAARLLEDAPGLRVVGLDNLNPYYDVRIKQYRLAGLRCRPGFVFVEGELSEKVLVDRLF